MVKVLVPLLTGKEKESDFVEAFTSKVDEIVLLQIIDKDFMNKTASAIGEMRQSRAVMEEVKKIVAQKKKKYSEATEWGSTINKIISLAVLQKVDKVFFVNQKNQFFGDILKELKKNKIQYEVVDVVEKKEENE
ncbi:MAG: hypothetical protein WCW44_04355 [archaeon]|jgi:hypothetical protein